MARRLIDMDALLQKLHDAGGCDAPKDSWADGYDSAINLAYKMTQSMPVIDAQPVDAVEVVRCKDCKYLMFSDMYGECENFLRIVRPDDFCSYGERK